MSLIKRILSPMWRGTSGLRRPLVRKFDAHMQVLLHPIVTDLAAVRAELRQMREAVKTKTADLEARRNDLGASEAEQGRELNPTGKDVGREPPAADAIVCLYGQRMQPCRVTVDRLTYEVMTAPDADDPVTLEVRNGTVQSADLIQVMLKIVRPGDIVLDLGANIGTVALAAAAAQCRVVAVEANPLNVLLLKAAATRNGFDDRLTIVHAAVTDTARTLEFLNAGPWGRIVETAMPSTVTVRGVRVDDLLRELAIPRVSFIKMDVEGSEVQAARGMPSLLSGKDAPPILYESNAWALRDQQETIQTLRATIESYEYQNYLIDDDRLVPVKPADFQAKVYVDILAVKGRPPRLEGFTVTQPHNVDEVAEKIFFWATSSFEAGRIHLAETLPQAGPEIRRHPRVVEALQRLRDDPSDKVRQAAAWVTD